MRNLNTFFKKRLTERGRRIDLRKFRERLLREGRAQKPSRHLLGNLKTMDEGVAGCLQARGTTRLILPLIISILHHFPQMGKGRLLFWEIVPQRLACFMFLQLVDSLLFSVEILFLFFFIFFECWVNPLIQWIQRKCSFTLLSPDTKTSPCLDVLNTF